MSPSYLSGSARRAAVLAAAVSVFFVGAAVSGAAELNSREAVQAARSWGYQLDGPNPDLVARSGCDLSVIDYSFDGEAGGALSAEDIQHIRASGPGKSVIAYLSIGEAEDYRFYWESEWSRAGKRPTWLGEENPEWLGNYQVEYWQPAWQGIIFGTPQSYVDAIIAAGFDGVFLDRVDAYLFWEGSRPDARREMVDFVLAIAAYGRSKKEDFTVLVQNGEELLEFPDYVQAIDGFAKEDLFYGADDTGEKNDSEEVAAVLDALETVTAAHLPVFLVEYLDDPKAIGEVRTKAAEHGFRLNIAQRDLNRAADCRSNGG